VIYEPAQYQASALQVDQMFNARNQKLDREFPSSAPKMNRVAEVGKRS
jgi:hypothetical protein